MQAVGGVSSSMEPSRLDPSAQHISSTLLETKQVGRAERGRHDASKCRLTAPRRLSPLSTGAKTGTVACLACSHTDKPLSHSLMRVFTPPRPHELNLDHVRRRRAVRTLELLESLRQLQQRAPLLQSVSDCCL